MTDQTGSPAGGEAIFSTELPSDAPEIFDTPKAAADYFADLKAKKANPEAKSVEPAESAEPLRDIATAEEKELPDEGNGDPETVPAEVTEEAKPEDDLPPLEPPRSWTKAEKDRFQSLPRETQEYLSTREQEREREFRRSQNEIADQRKAVQAEREAAEKARQQYEARLPTVEQMLLDAQARDFSDIKSMPDVERLQQEDPFRWQAWQVHQQKLQYAAYEKQQAEQRQQAEQSTKWAETKAKEGSLFEESLTDAERAKAKQLQPQAGEYLQSHDFRAEELNAFLNGEKVSPLDHRMQRLIFKAMQFDEIQKAKTAVAAKTLPPVQRPGTSKPSGQGVNSERFQALSRKSELTVNEATELYTLQQRPRRAS